MTITPTSYTNEGQIVIRPNFKKTSKLIGSWIHSATLKSQNTYHSVILHSKYFREPKPVHWNPSFKSSGLSVYFPWMEFFLKDCIAKSQTYPCNKIFLKGKKNQTNKRRKKTPTKKSRLAKKLNCSLQNCRKRVMSKNLSAWTFIFPVQMKHILCSRTSNHN